MANYYLKEMGGSSARRAEETRVAFRVSGEVVAPLF